MQQQRHPAATSYLRHPHPAPKTTTREPTSAEFEQLGRTVFADLTRLNELSLETARVRNHMAQAVSALTYRTGPGVVEPCQVCNYDICQCERIG